MLTSFMLAIVEFSKLKKNFELSINKISHRLMGLVAIGQIKWQDEITHSTADDKLSRIRFNKYSIS